MRQKIKITQINVPVVLEPKFKRASRKALKFLTLDTNKKYESVELVFIYDPNYDLDSRTLVQAYPLNTDPIVILVRLGTFLFQQESEDFMEYVVYTSIVHELIHIMRPEDAVFKLRSVSDFLIEEGLAVWLTAHLAGLQPGIDLDELKPKNISKIWQKIIPLFGKKIEISNNLKLGQDIYKLGFYLIDEYTKANPDISLRDLLFIKRKKLNYFINNYLKK